MKSKTLYTILGLVIGITFILIIGANDKRHCVCNPAGCHWVSGLAKGQTPVADSFCLGDDKKEPTATDGPRLPTERPTATQVANTPTPRIEVIITDDPPKDPTATATPRATQAATSEVADPKVDPKLSDPAATPCPNCQPCPDIRCSLATIAAAQATQAAFIVQMP